MNKSCNRRNFIKNGLITTAGLLTVTDNSFGHYASNKLSKKREFVGIDKIENISVLVRNANINRVKWPDNIAEHLNLYIGNGRFGSCFDVYGFMNNGFRSSINESISNTMLMHADHWSRGAWGMDSFLPVARLVWVEGQELSSPIKYNQLLDIWDGILVTDMIWSHLKLKVKTYFHAKCKDLLIYEIQYDSLQEDNVLGLALVPEQNTKTGHYKEVVNGKLETIEFNNKSFYLGRLKVGSADSAVSIKLLSQDGKASFDTNNEGLLIRFSEKKGRHMLVIGVAAWGRRKEMLDDLNNADYSSHFEEESKENWHKRWGNSYVQIPDPDIQKLWMRNHYYLLASYAPEVRSPAPPTGWTNNAWPRHFPQDMTCIAAALLRLGHIDVVRSVVEFYRSNLECMKQFTKEVFGSKGVMWAWEFPIGPNSELLRNGTPNWPQYEIHNAAYPAYMAREVSKYLNDPAWSRDVAWPIIFESALFYASSLKIGTEGTWNLQVIPSMGQDESGPRNAKNYLDALYSARYSISTALVMAIELGISNSVFYQWRKILSDGLAFKNLYNPLSGVYATCQTNNGLHPLGMQKHPVQLNPLMYLPAGNLNDAEKKAYKIRYDLCEKAHQHYFKGWTVPAYLISSARIGNGEELLKDLNELKKGNMVDESWIQIFEGTQRHDRAYYTTNGGWFLSSICEAMVTDFWGETKIGNACPDSWKEVNFHNLCTNSRQLWSGGKVEGQWLTKVEQMF